jgi:hypothetical protein
MDTEQIHNEDLPAGLQELREMIGTTNTLNLVKHYGGLYLKVPSHFNDSHQLVGIIGAAATLELIKRYAGTTVYIATAHTLLRVMRNIEISHRFESGESASKLARIYKMSERNIWNILKRPETLRQARPKQRSLF